MANSANYVEQAMHFIVIKIAIFIVSLKKILRCT